MGTTSLGIFIKTDQSNYDPATIAKDLFGATEIYNPLESHLTYGAYVTIITFEHGIEILEPTYVEKFVVNGGSEIKRITEYFNHPEFILAHMIISSAYGYGFRFIGNDGQVRYRNRDSDGNLCEGGIPLPEELKYLNANYFLFQEEEEEFLAYSLDKNKENIDGDHSFILESLVNELMLSRLGYVSDGNIMAENICLEIKKYKLPKQ